jgi:hypothetical protein
LSSKKTADAKKLREEGLVLQGLLKEAMGDMPAQDFAVKHGLRIGTLNNWLQGRGQPRLGQAVACMKALGFDRLQRLGIDLGGLMDTLRGDMSESRREAHHWIEEIFTSGPAPDEFQQHILRYLREKGGRLAK